MTARPSAEDVEQRVNELLDQMTIEEKLGMLGGVDAFDVPGLPRLGVPRLGTSDSPFGVRATGPATLYPGGIALAATWNPELARRIGTEIGRDMRARGRHYSLGPGVNIYRSPLNGRNFEYFGEDPWLAARMAVAYVAGLQSQGASATVKHFVGNESEYARHVTDARIDERALREIHLPAFEAAVKEARAGAVMSAYNLTNGVQMSANRRLAVEVLKEEWGFDGVLMSDWGGVHDTEGAANGGTDLEMPGPQYFDPAALLPLVRSGRVAEATIDDKVRRLLRNVVRFGWMDRPQLDPSVPRYRASARAAALQGAREAMVLLVNDGPMLPLDRSRVRTVAVIGPTGHPGVPLGWGSAAIPTYHRVSFVEGIGDYLGEAGAVHHARGIPSIANVVARTRFTTEPGGETPGLRVESFATRQMDDAPTKTSVAGAISAGAPLDLAVLAAGEPLDFSVFGDASRPFVRRWTGWYTPEVAGAHDLVVQLGGFGDAGYRLRVDGRVVADRWSRNHAVLEATTVELDARPHEVALEYHTVHGFGVPFLRMGIVRQGAWVDAAAVEMAARADAVVVAVGFDDQSEAENWDRTFRLPPGQDELIARVAAANRNVVVVLTGGGACDMTRWLERVPAVIQAWYPGQEAGRALAEILFGDVSPSGHLPATFERRAEDNPTFGSYYPAEGSNVVEYREGVFVGYRGYERNGTAPLFPFGHGLSYTTFRYDDLVVSPVAGPSGAGARWEVSFDVTNAGEREGAAVAQVYVRDPEASVPRPPKELEGFAKVALRPGETRRVTVPLTLRSLAFYDVEAAQWRAEAGTFEVLVGGSSADTPLRERLTLEQTLTTRE
ncbi:MAG: glycoside hydrolase family 3 C-terminal domain-containing protein [Gemmatimonadaceae bacterium]